MYRMYATTIFACLLMVSTSVSATSMVATTAAIGRSVQDSSNATSDVSLPGSSSDRKVILAVRDNTTAFVATGGRLRGARLEQAFLVLRESHPALRASDLQVAQATAVSD